MLTEEQAKQKVCEFLIAIGKDSGFTPERIRELLGQPKMDNKANAGPRFNFRSPFGNFSVAERTGDIVSYQVVDANPVKSPELTQAQAEAEAGRFVKLAYPQFDQMNFKLTDVNQANDRFELRYAQQKRPGEISIFPNFIMISERTDTGAILFYACSHLPFSRTTPVKVSEQQARQIIKKAYPTGSIETLELYEKPVNDAAGSITTWSAFVLFEEGVAVQAEQVYINADTGEVVKDED
ncbi:MAG TPA: PepSY domain-containing protein [Candidatus Acidoferrales bacterium]|nr:PepSY domain-containing protein [Candidatus Acidoferrales bacterium]